MSVTLRPEHEQVLLAAIDCGLARTTDEALDQAIDTLRCRLPQPDAPVRTQAELFAGWPHSENATAFLSEA